MRSTFWSRLALALLSVTGVFVPLAEASTFDEVTIDGARRARPREASPPPAALTAPGSPPALRAALLPSQRQRDAGHRLFLVHRAWLL